MQIDPMCAKLAHMGEVDEKTLGVRVREARESAGLTQGELASRVNLDRTAVNKIEGGIRKVTALELSDIATALGVRMASFFSEPIPALVSHRSAQGLDTADSKIDRLLANIASDVEFVHTLAPAELGLPDSTAVPLPRPDALSDADSLAIEARTLLGFDAAEPVHDLVGRVASIGLLAFSIDLGVDTADAGTILLRQGGVSLINSHNKVGRRRLALAHELGHFLVADEYTVDWRVTDQRSSDLEARLDRFARSLLLPEPGIRAAWDRHASRHPRVASVLLASEFRVDMATLSRRLDELRLVDSSGAALIRGVKTTRTDIVEFGLYVPTDMEGTSLPVPFQKAILRAFRDERISRERALELLYGTFVDDDLPALRERREDELWNFVS
jgi:Zn-dependent peptidase ImmA (M78 family)/transcriptional regulator with XRE-family HTH domain